MSRPENLPGKAILTVITDGNRVTTYVEFDPVSAEGKGRPTPGIKAHRIVAEAFFRVAMSLNKPEGQDHAVH